MSAFRNLTTVYCLLVGLSGCATLASNNAIVYQDAKLAVSIAPDPTVDTSTFSTLHDHPAQIKPDHVVRILSQIGVERSRGLLVSMVLGPQHEPAFSRDEVAVLAPHISTALSRASSEDRVLLAVSRAVSAKNPETLEWAIWVQGGNLHMWLTRHELVMDHQRSELTAALQGGASRGPGVSRDLPGDLNVVFSYPEYVIAMEPTVATQLFGNPHAHVVIDYRRFLSDARRGGAELNPSTRNQDSSGTAMASSAALSATPAPTAPPVDVQAASERVKILEAQVNDLLGVVKQLTKELAESNRALTARDEEIRTLKGQVKPSDRQRKSSSP
ncbi:MAG: hypothetical protein Q8N04_17975 [Nitrospira sp.]|nr:hypothetical protein [Nitrospira sp.]